MFQPYWSRRGFLAASSIAAPAILKSQDAGGAVRVAMVGAGNRGSLLLRSILKVPGAQVVAVCDIDQSRAEQGAAVVREAGGNARVWTDFRKMLDQQKEIDAVIQATPDYTHKDVDIAILEVGKHLYAEKPLALTVADCRAVVSAAKQAKGIMQVGFQLRHDPNRNAAETFIHSGGAGKVLFCHGIRHGGDLPRNIPWYFDKTKCGDIVVDQGIHILDLFTWAIGAPPRKVYGSGGTTLFVNDPPGRTVMDHYSLVLDYPGGVNVNFSHNYFDPPGFTGIQERVFCANGAVDLVKATFQPRDSREPRKLDVPNADKDASYMSLDAFISNVRGRRTPLNNVESAFNSTLLPLMATRAIYEQRVVAWEEMLKG